MKSFNKKPKTGKSSQFRKIIREVRNPQFFYSRLKTTCPIRFYGTNKTHSNTRPPSSFCLDFLFMIEKDSSCVRQSAIRSSIKVIADNGGWRNKAHSHTMGTLFERRKGSSRPPPHKTPYQKMPAESHMNAKKNRRDLSHWRPQIRQQFI